MKRLPLLRRTLTLLAVLLPMLAGMRNAGARHRVRQLLTAQVVHRAGQTMPAQRSRGEQQSVAIPPGFANRLPMKLANERIAPRDREHARFGVHILNEKAGQLQTATVVITPGEKIIRTFKRIHHIRGGATHDEVGQTRAFA